MNMEKMYPLIGDKSKSVKWVVTRKMRPDLAFSEKGQSIYLSASSYPLLKLEQVPPNWLNQDPGFPILLVEEADTELSWVYNPVGEQKRTYQLRQKKPIDPKNILIVLEEDASVEDIEFYLCKYKGDVRFLFRNKQNFEFMAKIQAINKYTEKFFDSYFFCYQSFWRVDLIVFQNENFSSYIAPHILHAIHMGGVIKREYLEKTPTKSKALWYGTWELFDE